MNVRELRELLSTCTNSAKVFIDDKPLAEVESTQENGETIDDINGRPIVLLWSEERK